MVTQKEEQTASASAQRVWTKRPFGESSLMTTRIEHISLDRLDPNYDQPREEKNWVSDILKNEIEDAQGVFEPILVEPIPDAAGKVDLESCKFLIVDGHRRYVNTKRLLEDLELKKKSIDPAAWADLQEKFAYVNIEVTEAPLTLVERLRVWVFIHRDRREWRLQEREKTAFRLITQIGQARAASAMGVSIKELSKFVEISEEAERLDGLLEDAAAQVTWAREIVNIREKYRTPEVMEALRKKIGKGLIVNSKDVRSLRHIVPHQEALAKFMEDSSTADEARLVAGAPDPVRATRSPKPTAASTSYGVSLASDIDTFSKGLAGYSWEELVENVKDPEFAAAVKAARAKLAQLEQIIDSSST